jgi:hypothetical protein
MKTSRYVLYAGAIAAVLVLALIARFGLRDGNHVAASPSPSASPSTSAAASATAGLAGAITGRLGYGSDFVPPVTVYAISVSDPSVWFSTDTPRFGNAPPVPGEPTWPPSGPGTYLIGRVTPGTYYVIAYRNDNPGPQLKDLPGAYTQWAAKCSSSDPTVPSPPPGPCSNDHSLVPVIVTAGQTVTYIDIVDWFGPQGGIYPPRPR